MGRGARRRSAEALGVSEHEVLKTLVFEKDARKPLVVLMHGDREVSATALERVYVNGGKRGFLIRIAVAELVRVLQPVLVEVGIKRG